ncbi:MAG: hypothetical protein MR922_09490 [Lachnospiraceae bacterium]|nr:hypothetical protein [Lachnospiraceae bacterium]
MEGLVNFPMDVHEGGILEARSILSDLVVIQFSVPDRAWSELSASEEWKSFQILLEKHQKEYTQKQHKAAVYRQGI